MSARRSTRRQFHQHVALAGAAALAAGTQPAAGQGDPLKTSGDAMCALIEARFGKQLTAEQLDEVKKAVRTDIARVEYLKRYPLKNSDEPSFIFRADI